MTLGHPATSNSPEIDYVINEDAWAGDPSCYSETVVLRSADGLAFAMREDADFPTPMIRPQPEVIRVAVPSMACKISEPFMAMCQRIAQKSPFPTEFHFFPNMVGMTWQQITKQIRAWLPTAIVYPRSDYNRYLLALNECDLHLSTYPFGGTNSNIDSMRLAIPMIAMEGLECHSQSDAGMLRRGGLPESLVAYNPAEYERTALRLITRHEERVACARQLLDTNVEGVFLNQSRAAGSREFLDIFEWIYTNHELIRASNVRYWTRDARLGAGFGGK
jgi:hypothetical protein